MRYILTIVISLHGFVHLLGFMKAFEFSELSGLTLPISEFMGILWLTAYLLFGLSLYVYVQKNENWWVITMISALFSQILVVIFWHDAKTGTIPNSIILFASLLAFSKFRFKKKIQAERKSFLATSKIFTRKNLDKKLHHIPTNVKNWLDHIGANNEVDIRSVHLIQKIKLKLEKNQEKWLSAHAEQHFTINPPGFHWAIDLKMNKLFNIQGRDKFENGEGEMLMKLQSIFPIVNVADNDKVNEAAIQRYLAEIVWFPSAAWSPHITWEEIDDYSAKATFAYANTSGSGVFHFNQQGDLTKFTADRYKEINDQANRIPWVVDVLDQKIMGDILVPTKTTVTWKMEDGDWTWLELEVLHLEYIHETSNNGHAK